jgi:hypothetical protein
MGKNEKKSYYGKGFFQTKFCTSAPLYHYLSKIIDSIPRIDAQDRDLYHWFVAHIFASMYGKDKHTDEKGPFIPIGRGSILRDFGRSFDVHLLKDAGIIEIKPHNTFHHKSREFRLVEGIYKEAFKLHIRGVKDQWRGLWGKHSSQKKMVNLVTGKRWRTPVKSQFKYINPLGDNFNTPALIRRSIRTLQPFPFNARFSKCFPSF